MKKILIYNSGGGLGDSIQIMPLILSLQNHFKNSKFFYLGAHSNHHEIPIEFGSFHSWNLLQAGHASSPR